MRRFLFPLLFFLTFFISELLASPSAPSGGGVEERQLEKEYEEQPLEQKRDLPDMQIEIPEKRLELPEGTRVFIKKMEIRGNQSISTNEICSWVTCVFNRKLSLKEIDHICQRIEKGYANKGYPLARAYPPEQKITDGILIIKIREGF